MKKLNLILSIIVLISNLTFAAIEKSGEISVNETWSEDTVKVSGNITINNGITLTIDPGVYVQFQGHYAINVNGTMLSQGTSADSIFFTIVSDSIDVGWNGIVYSYTSSTNDSSKFEFCHFSYSQRNNKGGAFYIQSYSKIIFSNCKFSNNKVIDSSSWDGGGAVYFRHSDINFYKCEFVNNSSVNNVFQSYGGAMFIVYSNTKIENCIFRGNGNIAEGGALAFTSGRSLIVNCLFDGNEASVWGGAIVSNYSFIGNIVNNTFVNNKAGSGMNNRGGAIFICGTFGRCRANLINSIIWNNDIGQILITQSDIDIKYSCIENGENTIIKSGDVTINYEQNNIDTDPVFKDIFNNDFNLDSTSLLVNAGIPDTIGMGIPRFDLNDNARISSNRIDIGAYELQNEPEPRIKINNNISHEFIRYDSLFSEKLFVLSYPESYSYTFLNKPEGMYISNDSLIWVPTKQQAGADYSISLKVENLQKSDTINFIAHVLDDNEFFELEDQDIIWDYDTVKVYNSLTINDGRTLTIVPGVYVEFQGHYKLDVQGRLLAEGNLDSMIMFIAKDTLLTNTSGGWHGIKFDNTPESNDTSIIKYCILNYGNAYSINNNNKDKDGGAIFIYKYSKIIISNCIIMNNKAIGNGGAISCSYSSPIITNTVIARNIAISAGAIDYGYTSSPKVINCTIVDNSSGIYIYGCNLHLTNTILWDNGYRELYGNGSIINYCNIKGNVYPGDGNISIKPEFTHSDNYYYNLQAFSPCINAGNPEWSVDSLCSTEDAKGNDRIKFERVDIGAYEYMSSIPVLFDKTISINENLPQHTVIDSVTAYYYDSNELEYSLISGNINSAFAIDLLSGKVTVNSSQALNYELIDSFDLEIRVTDGIYSDTAVLKIILNDIIEYGINPFQSSSREGAVNFVIDNAVYVGLGNNADSVMCNFWKYDLATDIWAEMAQFPGDARSEAVSFVINSKAYVGLGRSEFPYQYYKDFYEYNPETDQWKQISDFGGTARYNSVAFVIDSLAYVGTGKDASDEQSDFWKYNPESDTWMQVADISGDKRNGAAAFVINGHAYVSGGKYYDSYSVQLSDVQEYNPVTDTWSEKIFADGINLSISNASSFVMGNKGYICYGNKEFIVSYNPETNEVINYGDVLNLTDKRFDPIAFTLDSIAYFGLGYYDVFDPVYQNDILELNHFPSNITLSNNIIVENSIINTIIGSFFTADEDLNENFTYNFVIGDGNNDADNGSFLILENELRSAENIDFETQNEYFILVQVNDSLGATYQKAFTILVDNVNEPPNDVTLSNESILENSLIGSEVGIFTAFDEDDEDSYTYSLVTGDGTNDADNNSFTILGNELQNAEIFNYETKNMYYIFIQVEDSQGAIYQKPFTIDVNDINDSPTNILLSNDVIDENSSIGTVIGSFSTIDEDEGDIPSYSFIVGNGTNDADNSSFIISENELQNAEIFDYEIKNEYHIYIETSDEGGVTYQKEFIITISNILETGVQDFESYNIKVFPNPTNGILNLDLTRADVNNFELKIVNSKGKLIFIDQIKEKNSTIDLTGNSKGMYLLIIENSECKAIQKIILE